jgi:hypothetical protein
MAKAISKTSPNSGCSFNIDSSRKRGNKKTQKKERKIKRTSNLFPPTVYLKSFEERNGSNNNTRAKKGSKVPEGTAAVNDGMKEQEEEEEEAEAGDKAPAEARTDSGM